MEHQVLGGTQGPRNQGDPRTSEKRPVCVCLDTEGNWQFRQEGNEQERAGRD